MNNSEYHAHPALGSTTLKKAVDSMQTYKHYIESDPIEATDNMNLGTAVHTLVLEPELFDSEIAVKEKVDGRTKTGKEYNAMFAETSAGKTIITTEQFKEAQLMRDSVMDHPEVKKILNCRVEFETSGFYIDEETGIECKYRPDIRTNNFIADLKTCQDATQNGFAKQVSNLGYHISAAHYLEGDRILKKINHEQFIFICVESKPPYQVGIYRLGPKSLNKGYMQRNEALKSISNSRETGVYPLLNDGEAMEIEMPGWALNN